MKLLIMKNIIKVTLSVLFVFLFSYFIYDITHKNSIEQTEVVSIKYDTIRDTIVKPEPVPFFIDTTTPRITQLPADTIFILKTLNEFNELKLYMRSIINDSVLNVVISDSVQHNKLKGYSVKYDLRQKTITHTITEQKKVNSALSLYICADVIYSDRPYLLPGIGVGFGKSVISASVSDKFFMISYKYQIFNL